MTRTPKNLLGLLFLAWASVLGCADNGGVEAGNPEIKGKSLLIAIEGSGEVYSLKLLDGSAVVSQVKSEDFETVPSSSFHFEKQILDLEAEFSDGTRSAIQSLFDESGALLALRLRLNDIPTPAISSETDGVVTEADSLQAFFQIATGLCQRIISCNSSYIQETCESEALGVPGLSAAFGDPSSETLGQAQERVRGGALQVDEGGLEECITGIETVPCSFVRKNFNDTDPPDYSKLRKLVPKPICARGLLLNGA